MELDLRNVRYWAKEYDRYIVDAYDFDLLTLELAYEEDEKRAAEKKAKKAEGASVRMYEMWYRADEQLTAALDRARVAEERLTAAESARDEWEKKAKERGEQIVSLIADRDEWRKRTGRSEYRYEKVVTQNDSAWMSIIHLVYAIMGWEEGRGIDDKDIDNAVERAIELRSSLAALQEERKESMLLRNLEHWKARIAGRVRHQFPGHSEYEYHDWADRRLEFVFRYLIARQRRRAPNTKGTASRPQPPKGEVK